MIHSMTGYAAVQRAQDGACYVLEVRSLNSKYHKLSIKVPESLQFLESETDRIGRGRLARGSVALHVPRRRAGGAGAGPVHVAARQAAALPRGTGMQDAPKRTRPPAQLVPLPTGWLSQAPVAATQVSLVQALPSSQFAPGPG